MERALWAAVRALEESAALTQRLGQTSSGSLRTRFEDKELNLRQQVEVLKRLLSSRQQLTVLDSEAILRAQAELPGED